MRIAALYDIHGNLPALEAVLDEIQREGADEIVVGGDVVPGPMPRETMECLLRVGVPLRSIRGNGDREVLACMRGVETGTVPEAFREVMSWNARQLQPDYEELIAGWPLTLRLNVEGVGRVLFCHATPQNDTDIFTRVTPDERLAPVIEGLDVDLLVCGHTHMQFDRIVGGVRIVNAGSVGMPFGEPGAYWLSLGPGVQLRRTSYDLEAAAERIRGTAYPQAETFAAGNVLKPPSEEQILTQFSRVELKEAGSR